MKEIDKRLEYAKKFVEGAGKILLKKFKKGKAEAHIIGSIFNKFPEDSILADQSGEINVKNSKYCWVIDPIIEQKHFFLSLAIKSDIEVEVAVVYIPELKKLYTNENIKILSSQKSEIESFNNIFNKENKEKFKGVTYIYELLELNKNE